MFKKIVCLCVSFVLVCVCLGMPIHAIDTEEMFIIQDESRVNAINELFALRARLALNIEENRENIGIVDQQLALLGVEEISYAEVAAKLGTTASPQVAVYPSENITWTSYRAINVYAGQFYELQVITGVPANVEGLTEDNCDLVSFAGAEVKNNYGGTAATLTAFKYVGSIGVGFIPEIGTILSTGISILQAVNDTIQSISPSTYVSGVNAVYGINTVANEQFIFIKMQGAADSDQVCGYAGNRAECMITGIIPLYWDKDGDGTVDSDTLTISYEDSIVGPGYNDSYYIASQNFYNYRNGAWNFNAEYRLTSYRLDLLKNTDNPNSGVQVLIRIPCSEMPFLLPNH